MDLSLHEIGVSENKVGKKVKVMATAFMGRVKAYGAALDAGNKDMLIAALQRNLYRDANDMGKATLLADQVLRAASDLDDQKDANLLAGTIAPPINILDHGHA